MSRTGGCPFNIRDYSVTVKHPVAGEWVRVKGLTSMSVLMEAETGDGRTGDALWSEAFVKRRDLSGSLEGKPIVERATGAMDAGQAILRQAAVNEGGCDGDLTLRVADAVGRAAEYDCVITKESLGADADGETVRWDWKGVGSPRAIPYVQAASVGFLSDGQTVSKLTVAAGASKTVRVSFSPANASNQRFGYYMADETIARVAAADGLDLCVEGVSAGETTLAIRSMNNARTAALTVEVS